MSDVQPTKILVVDDNPATLYSTSRVLRSAGYTVVEAGTGTQAVTAAANGVDLVVLDVNLPDFDGFEVCRQIRRSEVGTRTPVIHLSATFVNDVDKVHGLEVGADGYLTHPVEPPVLIATVNAFLRTRAAELELRQSEAKFKSIFDNALNGIALLDKALIVGDANSAMCTLLARAKDDIVGKSLMDFVAPDYRAVAKSMSAELACNSHWNGVLPLFRPNGDIVHVQWSISQQPTSDAWLAILNDVSDRIKFEHDREELLVSERAARSEAERANRLKDDFLATLSHELRTPLHAISGWAQVLKFGKPTGEELAEGVEAIERNSRIQAQMISDLLDVSRITSGKLRLDIQQVDPAATIEAALMTVMPAASAKDIRIVKLLDSHAGVISGDPSRLQQVIWNLVNNAVKFTPKGGKVQVKLTRVDSHIEIAVADSGAGIGHDLLPYVFERFRQGAGPTTRGQMGLGLGLAIAKQLVEMHGGTISAHSDGENQGAEFTVTLPLSPVRQDAESLIPMPVLSDRRAGPVVQLGGIRVLLVDDDEDARRLTSRVLAESHAEICAAASAAEGLQKIEEFVPDVLVSDLGMPTQDGFEFIRAVRAKGYSHQRLPAIALTAFARTEDRRRAMMAGFQLHLAKPVDATELVASIATLVGRTGEGE
jgi:PAS domain S-box-containing protein